MHDQQIGFGKFFRSKRAHCRRLTFRLFQLNDDGTYNKTGMGEALKKYWLEWPIDKIELINNKCHDEGETRFTYTVSITTIYIYIYAANRKCRR